MARKSCFGSVFWGIVGTCLVIGISCPAEIVISGTQNFSTAVGNSTDSVKATGGASLVIDSPSVSPIPNNMTLSGNGNQNGALHFNQNVVRELTGTLSLSGGTRLTTTSGSVITLSGTITGNGDISSYGTASDKGKITITGNVSNFNGGFNAYGAALQLGTAEKGFQISKNNNLESSDQLDIYVVGTDTTAGTLRAGGSFAKYGANTLTLQGNTPYYSTFSGKFSVNAGTLKINGYVGTGSFSVADGATLAINTATFANNLTSITGRGDDGLGSLHFTADTDCSSNIAVSGVNRIVIDNGKTVTLSGILSGSGTFAAMNGTIILTGANTHSGNLDINSSGTLILGDGVTNPTVKANYMNVNANLIWDVAPETTVSFNSRIAGDDNGRFVKQGDGTLVLGGTVTPKGHL